MDALLRPFAAILSVCFSAAYFGPAHRLLPPVVRMKSAGFISVGVAFFLASLARHAGAGDQTLLAAFVAALVWLFTLGLLLGRRSLDFLCLAMAASAGVDMTVVVLDALGLQSSAAMSPVFFVWEVAAIVVAVWRRSSQKSSSERV